mmetsp:Transcript_7834/g.21509  ORF Transcript_7834/g.21509 Transcript_7834/m.21509 type:complete len:248 (+) Transcript_7834:196-939(+)
MSNQDSRPRPCPCPRRQHTLAALGHPFPQHQSPLPRPVQTNPVSLGFCLRPSCRERQCWGCWNRKLRSLSLKTSSSVWVATVVCPDPCSAWGSRSIPTPSTGSDRQGSGSSIVLRRASRIFSRSRFSRMLETLVCSSGRHTGEVRSGIMIQLSQRRRLISSVARSASTATTRCLPRKRAASFGPSTQPANSMTVCACGTRCVKHCQCARCACWCSLICRPLHVLYASAQNPTFSFARSTSLYLLTMG